MATLETPPPATLGGMLQSLPRPFLYLLLIMATSIPLFFDIHLPNKPSDAAMDLYAVTMKIPEGSTVLVSTEWTNGTRAESAGEFEALLRMLMHRNVKFVIFSIGDPQAPPVAKDEIRQLNEERKKNHERTYERWNDWIEIGYYANAEGTAVSLAASIKNTFAGKKDINPQGVQQDIFESPVLKNVSTLKDTPVFFEVTASSTSTIYIQRISSKVPLALLCTGVMGPEAVPYYSSGQLVGLAAGLKGVLDLETLMVDGLNSPDKDGVVKIASPKSNEVIPGFMDPKFQGKGVKYFPALHVAMVLLILAIIAGNLGMFLEKGKSNS